MLFPGALSFPFLPQSSSSPWFIPLHSYNPFSIFSMHPTPPSVISFQPAPTSALWVHSASWLLFLILPSPHSILYSDSLPLVLSFQCCNSLIPPYPLCFPFSLVPLFLFFLSDLHSSISFLVLSVYNASPSVSRSSLLIPQSSFFTLLLPFPSSFILLLAQSSPCMLLHPFTDSSTLLLMWSSPTILIQDV